MPRSPKIPNNGKQLPPPPSSVRGSLCSAWDLDATNFSWDNRWGVPLEASAAGVFGTAADQSQPPSSAIFMQARRWSSLQPFIGKLQALRMGYLLYGVLGLSEKLKAKGKKAESEYEWHPGIQPADPKDREALLDWKQKNAEEIQRVVFDIVKERQVTRNVVALWQDKGKVLIRPPERCKYSDEFGAEKLVIRLDLTTEKIQAMNISPKAKAELLKNPKELTLTEDSEVFKFKVLKDAAMGQGFGWPDTASLYNYCALEESLAVGDRQLADAARAVYEQHKLGHQIQSGPHAGSPAHFAFEPRRQGVKKEVKDSKGHKLVVTNFDHDIIIGAGRPDPKQYDAKRYLAVAEQMGIWGVPYAQMWSGIVNPFLMSLAKQDATTERLRLQPYLAFILRKGMRCPVDVVVQFSDACFLDTRSLLDALKTGLAGGAVSQGTYLTQTGLASHAQELPKKEFEAGLDEKLTHPAYDAAHGPKDAAGKPPGRNDRG